MSWHSHHSPALATMSPLSRGPGKFTTHTPLMVLESPGSSLASVSWSALMKGLTHCGAAGLRRDLPPPW